jgi:hypothetical protein
MELKIREVTEADFDTVIADAGGERILDIGNADYVLGDAVLELKLVAEEGFDKISRQRKLAALFRKKQSIAPVVIIDPHQLEANEARAYHNIVAGPIKTHVKKAAAQLQRTVRTHKEGALRVLVIINVGYTALSMDEFRGACVRIANRSQRHLKNRLAHMRRCLLL